MKKNDSKNENNYKNNDNRDYRDGENKNSDQKLMRKKKRSRNRQTADRQIMHVTYFFLAIFVAMAGYFMHFQINEGAEIINNPYNKRVDILSKSIVRGTILSNDKTVLARTRTLEDGTEVRDYPYGSLLAHAVGYASHGQTGVELIANYRLLTSNAPVLEIAADDLNGAKHIGDNVVTSIDLAVSEAAYEAMGNAQGAVIAIEPDTGKILAMISKPDYDPNTIADTYDALVDDETNSNLVNRATSGLYTPGSTFKLFTLYEYMKEHPDYESYQYDCSGSITVEDNTVKCSGGRAHGSETIEDSFAYSCNSSFINLGMQLDKTAFQATCKRLLFNSPLPLQYPYQESTFVLNEKSSQFESMQTMMGQGKTLVTPIHLSMIAAAIANDGVLMQPYIVTAVENHHGNTIKTYQPVRYSTLFSADEITALRKCMRSVVEYGTAKQLNSENYTAYGKTGTAQLKDGSRNNSLFMGYAQRDGKKLAVCVVVEDSGEGTMPAVSVTKSVFDCYFE